MDCEYLSLYVIMLITPPIASLPYKDELGPFTISIFFTRSVMI